MSGGVDRAERARADYAPAEDYASADFARLEKQRLWPKVWQIACREEELPEVGDQTVYDICDDSILILRSAPDRISAYYNACSHRGRQLATGRRRAKVLVCPFHGWRYGLDGKCQHVPDRESWGEALKDEDIALVPVRCETWGGFVFINMDPDAAPLREFLGAAADLLDPYEFQAQRFRWSASVEVDCNWKIAIEAFNETYHVGTTHSQIAGVFDNKTITKTAGPHGYVTRPMGGSAATGPQKAGPPVDIRPGILEFYRQVVFDTRAIYTERDIAAAARILTECTADTPPAEVMAKAYAFRKEAAEVSGVGWPAITPEQVASNGSIWQLFPNMVVLPTPTASLWYRARPIGGGEDPGRCIFEFWALERYVPGFSPEVVHEHYTDWRDFKALPPFLVQDFQNIPHIQRGVGSRGFRGARPNPVQEGVMANFHIHLRAMLGLS